MLLYLILGIVASDTAGGKEVKLTDYFLEDHFNEDPLEIELNNGTKMYIGENAYHLQLPISKTITNTSLDLKKKGKKDLLKRFSQIASEVKCPACHFRVRKLDSSTQPYVPAISMKVNSMVKNTKKRDAESDASDQLSDAIKQSLKNSPLSVQLTDGQWINIGLPNPSDDDYGLPTWAIVLIVLGVILLLILIIVLVVLYMRRKKKQTEIYEKLNSNGIKKLKDDTMNQGNEASSLQRRNSKTDDSQNPETTNFDNVEYVGKSSTLSTPEQTTATASTQVKPVELMTDSNLSAASTVQGLETTTIGTLGGPRKRSNVTTTNTKQSSSGSGSSSIYSSSEQSNLPDMNTITDQKSSIYTGGKLPDESKISSSADM